MRLPDLAAEEKLPGVRYVPAFVGLPVSDPAIERFLTKNYWARNPWSRLSVTRTLELRAKELATADGEVKTRHNLWTQLRLADPAEPVILPEFIRDNGVGSVDFIKLDVDGPDFLILRSLVPLMADTHVLGVGVEVNFFGSDDPDVHTFHNVDRLMRTCGFELCTLSMRRYSAAALPAPYEFTVPAQSAWGRPLQGDAIYLRDAAAPENAEWAHMAGSHKLIKLAALYSLLGMPDCAAEILLRFGTMTGAVLDRTSALDALVWQCEPEGLSYDQYIAEFEADSDRFYPARRVQPPAPAPANTTVCAAEARAAAAEVKAAAAEAKAAAEQKTREAAEADADAARNEAVHLDHDISRLHASTSWKLTAPLRAMVTAVRGR